MELPTLESLGSVAGKSVLVRSNLNVPIENGVIQDEFRLQQSIPTWQWLVDNGARVTVCAHLGRPKGRVVPELSLEPVRKRVAELIADVEVLENVRFDPGEEKNDPQTVARLIEGQDLFVLDAFGDSHRSHASVVGPAEHLPSAAGLLMSREVEQLGALLEGPEKPFVAFLGGAKVSDKIGVIDSLLHKVDTLIIGGAMSYTFLRAMGHGIGNSLLQEDQLDYCRRLLDSGKRIDIPVDFVVANEAGDVQVVGREIPDGYEGFDIGPKTRVRYGQEANTAATVFWNGPMGRFEDERFAEGTRSLATAVAKSSATTVIGGGDVVSAVNSFGLADQMSFVSTGGGASLEFIEQGTLPGIRALQENAKR